MDQIFRVGVTRDALRSDGSLSLGEGSLYLLDEAPGVKWEILAEDTRTLRPDQVRGYDAILGMAARVTAETLEGADMLTIVARLGAGYEMVDLDACSERGILVTNAPDGPRRSVATSILCFLLALSHRLFLKDRLVRDRRWSERLDYDGMGLLGRTLGSVALGNIGRELFTIARPLGMRHIAYARHATPEQAAELGVELVSLETLLRESDFLSINCALTPETHHLINAERLAMMKPTAFLINTSRGPVVDQEALVEALRAGKIQGAALDVFDQEPIDPNDPILSLDNVIVAPHALCVTDQLWPTCAKSACTRVLEVLAGRVPSYVVNPAVLENPLLQEKLRRLRERAGTN